MLEREWSGHASGPSARFAGVRTFLLLGTIGGVAGWLIETSAPLAAAAFIAGAGALIVAAYLTAAHRAPEAIDGTTELLAGITLMFEPSLYDTLAPFRTVSTDWKSIDAFLHAIEGYEAFRLLTPATPMSVLLESGGLR